MNPNKNAWSVILKDPVLRGELNSIELQGYDPEEFTQVLLDFFYRVDHLIKLSTHLICEEVC